MYKVFDMTYSAKAILYINNVIVESEKTHTTKELKRLLEYWQVKYEKEIVTSHVYVLVKEI